MSTFCDFNNTLLVTCIVHNLKLIFILLLAEYVENPIYDHLNLIFLISYIFCAYKELFIQHLIGSHVQSHRDIFWMYYLLLSTTIKFGCLFLFISPTPPRRKPTHVS